MAVIDEALRIAAAESQAALAAGTADGHDLMVLALERAAFDDQAGAKALFDRALALEPGNASILTGLASWYRQQGRLREAVEACDAAVRLAPDYADAWIERAATLGVGGSSAASRASYEQALRIAPGHVVALSGLAGQAARDGDMDLARRSAEAVLARDPANLLAAAALGQALLHDGDADAACHLLAPLVAAAPTSHARSTAAHALARAQERLGNAPAAYASYVLSKQDFHQINARAMAREMSHSAFVEAIIAGLNVQDPLAWMRAGPTGSTGGITPHIFLMGYPRSGTTLVENVLASLPGVAALEEWPTLGDTDQRFLSGDHAAIVNGVAEFLALNEDAVTQLRAGYWARVAAGGIAADVSAFVDMDPLKGSRLPFIAKLFPRARVMMMRRDPRDVVWSCFKTNFAVTSNTFEYATIEGAARHYDAMMRLTDLAIDRCGIDHFDIRYHELVSDFDRVTRAMCAFAGLEWTADVRAFDKTARTRGIATASAGQVGRGLYDGSGQWRPFARWLEPVMPILEPWIERFGHD